jgi:hypothetical protein
MGVPVGYAMRLVANDEDRNGNGVLATQLRDIAARYYIDYNIGIAVTFPDQDNVLLSGLSYLDNAQVREIASSFSPLEIIPGSVNLVWHTDDSSFSSSDDEFEFKLYRY